MSALTLFIGNKNYSSWSLRPWLLLRVEGIAFNEFRIPLYSEGSHAAIQQHSPSGRVPALRDDAADAGPLTVWDSLAICEYLADKFPSCGRRPWQRAPSRVRFARKCIRDLPRCAAICR